jgi:hypothetical protein
MRRMTGRRRRMNRVEERRRGWPCVALFAGKTTLYLAYFHGFLVKNFRNQCFGSVLVAVQIRIQNQHIRSMLSRIQIQGFAGQKL